MAKDQFTAPQDQVDFRRNRYDVQYQNQDQRNGYSIGTYEYPAGLMTKPDLQHYVAFYVNVRDKTKVGKELRNNDRVFKQNPEGEKATSALTQDAKVAGSKTILDNLGKIAIATTFLAAPIKGTGSKIAAAAAAGLITTTLANEVKNLDTNAFDWGTTSRLKDVITLHIEERPTVKYGTNYTEKDLGALAGLLMQGSAAKSIKDVAGEGTSRVIAELMKMPGLGLGLINYSDVRELATATRTNPFREVMFESVDYRTFNFRYRFFPKDLDESQKVRNIIKQFKIHMHPELSAQKMFYVYPSEFEIRYFHKDRENEWLHNFAKCALTDMQVDYGGDQFATFENGAPVEISVSLTFRELEQITTDGIKNGY